MSGAPLPGFVPARRTPPLLAVQGTADPFNAPATTAAYVRQLRPPTFLLWLDGAGHKEPYTTRDRWSGVVVRATLAFLAHELRGRPLRPLLRARRVPGVASLQADP
jgi:predicted alpha/beta-hydrolase family hydrolase